MNIVFWVLVLAAGFLLWLALSSMFRDIGEFFSDLIDRAKESMEPEEYEEYEEDE